MKTLHKRNYLLLLYRPLKSGNQSKELLTQQGALTCLTGKNRWDTATVQTNSLKLDSPRLATKSLKRQPECPIHVLLSVSNISPRGSFAIVEAHIEQIYVHESLESNGRINELKWQPLLYKFRQYSSVGEHLGNNFRYRPSLS